MTAVFLFRDLLTRAILIVLSPNPVRGKSEMIYANNLAQKRYLTEFSSSLAISDLAVETRLTATELQKELCREESLGNNSATFLCVSHLSVITIRHMR